MQLRRFLKKLLSSAGYKIVPLVEPTSFEELNPDITDREWEIIRSVQPFTMTSVERVLTVIRATAYLSENSIPGDLVECGVWRGGSSMAIAKALLERGDRSRRIYLYDTFEGMVEPTPSDIDYRGRNAGALLSTAKQDAEKKTESPIWAYASFEDVRANLAKTGYPTENIHFIKGPVEETIPVTIPKTIALLRLDTDWYESTRHELLHLYSRLSPGGILIVDDYGHWQGARRAVDEFFGGRLFLHRVDYTCRLAVKPQVASD